MASAWIPTATVCAAALAAIGCTNVLGLDPSVKDPCVFGGCADDADGGATDTTPPSRGSGDPPRTTDAGTSFDAAPPPSQDPPAPIPDAAAPDTAAPDASVLFRCGSGGGGRSTACDQTTQTCCATYESGAFDFTCMAQTQPCDGVPISCARQADCPGTSVCCVTDSSQSCVTRGTCTGDLVCDPGKNECPPGRQCEPFSNPTVPYYFCH